MWSIKTLDIAEKFLPSTVWNIPTNRKIIHLTFDDGPVPETTPELLDLLNSYNAKATFFLIGKNVEKNVDLYNRIIDEGHAVGNHTYSHVSGWRLGFNAYINDIKLASKFIDSKLFRPPYGKITPKQLKYLKQRYKLVFWDVLSYDFSPKISPQKVLVKVLSGYKEGSIIVFHDSQKASKNVHYVLPKVLEHFTNLGYTFSVIK